MCLLVESLLVRDGTVMNIEGHNRRLNLSRRKLGLSGGGIDLLDHVRVPAHALSGDFKCRVLVSPAGVESVEFERYRRRAPGSLRLVLCDDIEYSCKYADRSALNALLERKGDCDDILIVKRGLITDTSFSNIALYDGSRWITPAKPLLGGTRREGLLAAGLIMEGDIRPGDLGGYVRASLINAMLDLGDTVIPVSKIL